MAEQTLRFVTGQVVAGKYRIERQIGAGGMGIVAVATHLTLGQRVAIKFLNEEAMESADIIARFEREAKACVQLRSEHVARVTDVGTLENGAPYIVMEYLEGEDLSSLLNGGETLPISTVVDYVLQACEAIAEAHRLGIVHRDLKPANLFLTRRVDGGPLIKVLDFGISKVQADSIQDTKLTSTTAIIGSPSYMSPEQLRASRDVDHRGDIWALGVILFELLTNTLPFQSTNVMELCMKVASEPVPRIETRRADLPAGIGDIVARCLEKDPARRFQSISELVTELAPYQGQVISTTERIRRVGGGSPMHGVTGAATPFSVMQGNPSAMPPAYQSGSSQGPQAPHASQPPQAPHAQSSARVLVHGGTSVSWGKTEMHGSSSLPPPKPKSSFVGVAIAGLAVVLLVGGGGGGFAYWKHKTQLAAQPDALLPRDRTNLPPLVGSGSPPPGTAPMPASGAQIATNPMPQDRTSLTQPAVTNVPFPSAPSAAPATSTTVATSGMSTRHGMSGNGNGGVNGNSGARPGAGRATGATPSGGGDDILPDARK